MRSDETGKLLEQHSSLMGQLKDNIDTRTSLITFSRALQGENEGRQRDTAGALAHATMAHATKVEISKNQLPVTLNLTVVAGSSALY